MASVGRSGVDRRAGVHLEGVAAEVLGPVHGLVGPAEQLVIGIAMLGGHGDADGGRCFHLLPEDDEGLAHRLERALGQLIDGQLVDQSRQEDGELVPAHPGHGVLAADGVHQPLADLLDEVVARGVAQRVVDGLEVVQVDEEHAHRLAHPARAHQLLLDPVLEEPAVGQPGERVVPGHVRDLLQELEVLYRGGGLVGHAGQALVEVGIADGGRSAPGGRSWRRSRPRNAPAAKRGATTEAGDLVPIQQVPQKRRSSVDRSRTITSRVG